MGTKPNFVRRSFMKGVGIADLFGAAGRGVLGPLMQAKEVLRAPTFSEYVAPIFQKKCEALCRPTFLHETQEDSVHRIALRSLLRLVNAMIAQVLRRLSHGIDHLDDMYSVEIPFFLIHGSHPPAAGSSVARPAIA